MQRSKHGRPSGPTRLESQNTVTNAAEIAEIQEQHFYKPYVYAYADAMLMVIRRKEPARQLGEENFKRPND